jgi:hypothetical protein
VTLPKFLGVGIPSLPPQLAEAQHLRSPAEEMTQVFPRVVPVAVIVSVAFAEVMGVAVAAAKTDRTVISLRK